VIGVLAVLAILIAAFAAFYIYKNRKPAFVLSTQNMKIEKLTQSGKAAGVAISPLDSTFYIALGVDAARCTQSVESLMAEGMP
jgi:hypothetical protein